MVTSLEALIPILPEPFTEISLPSRTMVPSFFIWNLASPQVRVMLSPLIVSLPFKLMLFVLVDGWTLLIGSLVQSFYLT